MNQRFFTMNPPFPRHFIGIKSFQDDAAQRLQELLQVVSQDTAPWGQQISDMEIFREKMGFPWGFPWEHDNETWLMMVNDGYMENYLFRFMEVCFWEIRKSPLAMVVFWWFSLQSHGKVMADFPRTHQWFEDTRSGSNAMHI